MNQFFLIILFLFSSLAQAQIIDVEENTALNAVLSSLPDIVSYTEIHENVDGSVTFLHPRLELEVQKYREDIRSFYLSWDAFQENSSVGFCRMLDMEEIDSTRERYGNRLFNVVRVSDNGSAIRTFRALFIVASVTCRFEQ